MGSTARKHSFSLCTYAKDEVINSATVYKSGKDRKAVMQHTHYSFLGNGFIDSSVEYAASIVILPKYILDISIYSIEFAY